jgi:SAM-dependent methyltransferase
MNNLSHSERIRREFARQAIHFGEEGLTLTSKEYLEWMVDILPLQPHYRVLDVAAGTGHLSRAVAPFVREVVAVDMTREMLAEADREIRSSGLGNIILDEANASNLPYQNDSFDLVISRFAIHHFEKPEQQLDEMARVCKPHHFVGIIDLLSPDERDLSEPYNRLERLRDRSHTIALTKDQLVTAMENSGLAVKTIDAMNIKVDCQRWLEMTEADNQTRKAIMAVLDREINGGGKTGMRPFYEGDKLKFYQVWAIAIGTKSH